MAKKEEATAEETPLAAEDVTTNAEADQWAIDNNSLAGRSLDYYTSRSEDDLLLKGHQKPDIARYKRVLKRAGLSLASKDHYKAEHKAAAAAEAEEDSHEG
jgi:hypothetical protein